MLALRYFEFSSSAQKPKETIFLSPHLSLSSRESATREDNTVLLVRVDVIILQSRIANCPVCNTE